MNMYIEYHFYVHVNICIISYSSIVEMSLKKLSWSLGLRPKVVIHKTQISECILNEGFHLFGVVGQSDHFIGKKKSVMPLHGTKHA